MPDAAENLFGDESVSEREAAVDEAIRQAGGDPRDAIWGLIVQLQEREDARAAAIDATSVGYRRGRPPRRRLP